MMKKLVGLAVLVRAGGFVAVSHGMRPVRWGLIVAAVAVAMGWSGGVVAEPKSSKARLPATGQTTCWDSSGLSVNEIPCAGTGHDGDIQAGTPLSYTDNGDGTIRDQNTRLVWEKKTAACPGIHCWADIYTWAAAFESFIATLNTPPCFAGHCDWRLPNVKELQGILNYENLTPAVSAAFDDDAGSGCSATCTQVSNYWASSSRAFRPDFAWVVDFNEGMVFENLKSNRSNVRAVRGGS